MKISGNSLSQNVSVHDRTSSAERSTISGSRSEQPAARVALSPEAGFISSLRESAADPTEVRTELVDDMRAQIRNGTFEQSVDMDQMINSLLADL